jgi:hypothetical protein
LLHSLGYWFFHWVFDTLVDIAQDVQFRSSELQSFQCMDHKELQGEQSDVGVVVCAGPMVYSSEKCIRFAHRFTRSVMKEEIKVGKVE